MTRTVQLSLPLLVTDVALDTEVTVPCTEPAKPLMNTVALWPM